MRSSVSLALVTQQGITEPVSETVEMNFPTVLEAGSPRSKCGQGWFLQRPLSISTPSSLCVSVLISSSQKGIGHTGLGAIHMT